MRLNTGDRRYAHHPEFMVSPPIAPQQPTITQHHPLPQQQVSSSLNMFTIAGLTIGDHCDGIRSNLDPILTYWNCDFS